MLSPQGIPALLTIDKPKATVPQLTWGVLGELQMALTLSGVTWGVGEGRHRGVIISWGFHNKSPPLRGVNKQREAQDQVCAGLLPSEAGGRAHFMLAQLLVATDNPCCALACGCVTPSPPRVHTALSRRSPCVCLPLSSLVKTPVVGSGPTPMTSSQLN